MSAKVKDLDEDGAARVPNIFSYKAFISYSHKDEKFVRRLHRKLESFHIPADGTSRPKSLKPIFRDRDDLSAGSKLSEKLRDTLKASEKLIVICSPNAARSHWVNEEVLYFKRLGRSDHIFTVILDGDPFASKTEATSETECFPKALRYKISDDGTLSDEREEPLAADFRPQGDGRKLGFIKLVSGLLGMKLDDLVRRDLATARRRFAGVLVSSAIIISLLGSLTWFAMNSQKEAYARKKDAEDFVEFMLSDLREDLEPFGRLDLMESIGDKAARYYEQFNPTDFASDEDSNGRRARALHFIGELKYTIGATDEADRYFKQAYAITQNAIILAPTNPDRVREHALSAYLQSKTLRRRENRAEELTYLEEYERLAKELSKLEPQSQDAVAHRAIAKTNLGRLKLRTGNVKEATAELEAADTLFKGIVQKAADVDVTLSHTENLAWLAEAYRASDLLDDAHFIRARQVDILKAEYQRLPKDFRLLEGLIYAHIGFGNAARGIKDYGAAQKSHQFVLTKSNEALEVEPGREKMMRAKVAALFGLMNTSLDRLDFDSCKSYRQQIENLQSEPMVTSLKDSLYWTTHLPKSLSVFDRKFEEALTNYDL
ncbi:toll/interleukin-1 receptor domain-containing protein [Hellea balneolensis]|uniref:toll/interleukin-1 receptor domain-containing protein n=1 Tax=Hellea balneolensis TaxID=287478 RepID=UPI000420A533|nr:toll/interleukin-1 receptor domain-containing protein [Hellea balneolensis]